MNNDELIDWKRLRTMVPWSRAHLKRLEDAGKFPRRVKLGQGRCAWVLREIRDYIRERIQERDAARSNSSA